MSGLRVFGGSAHPALTQKIVDCLGVTQGEVRLERFPDGEIFVKILENIRGSDVYIIQPTCYPSNDNLMELLIMMDAMRRASAARITAVIPYYGYGRQDRKDQPRVPITARLVADLLEAAGATRVLTLDLHAQQIQGFFNIPVDHLYASPVIVKHLKSLKLPNPVVVSPDAGGLKMAYAYSQMLDTGVAFVGKQRKGPSEVEAVTLVGDVKGYQAILVDDMTTTAGTLTEAARMVSEHGATAVYAAVTHGVLTPTGLERLKASPIQEIVVTDSVPHDQAGMDGVTELSVSELLAEAILRIHRNESVTSLFNIG